MAIFRSIEALGTRLRAPVLAIGNFDGVHLGHRVVFREVVDRARKLGVDSAVLTFEPHPVRFFKPDTPEFRLTTPEQKFELLEACGLEGVVALEFDQQMSERSPEAFVDEILYNGISASTVLVGEGFKFGHKRAGDTDTLKDLCSERGIEVVVLPPVLDDSSDVISSTRIRDAIQQGEVDRVEALLGRHYEVHGKVVHGDKRGRDLGYPTANIETRHPLIPPPGIYATRLEDQTLGILNAATYIGDRPTFADDASMRIESFVIDAEESIDLYDKDVRLHFVARIREDRAFDSSEELVAQMEKDVEKARSILADAGPIR